MAVPVAPNRSQAWFPGRYVRLRDLHGVEVLPALPRRRHGGVRLSKTTLHGTAAELRALAVQLLDAAERVDPTPAGRRRRPASAAPLRTAA